MSFAYEKLEVWEKSKDLVVNVYLLLGQFPNTEKYSLCDQLRRSAVSVPSNIAEGSGRFSLKEKIHFVEIAYGSLTETFCQLQLAKELKYISGESITILRPKFEEVARMLSGYRNSLLSKL